MELVKKDFTIEGSNGRPMAADVRFPKGETHGKLVIYAHGINGFKDWGGMDLVAKRFAEAGFAFLKFNFSHNGTTPQDPTEFVDLEAYGNDNYSIRQNDLKLVLDYVLRSDRFGFKVDRIALLGHSRGGTDAILYTPHDERIHALITWAAVSEASTPWRKWDSAKLHEWQQEGVQYLKNGRTGQDLPLYYQLLEDYKQNKARFNVENAARKTNIPWLICHGTADESVFIKDAYDLKEWQPAAQTFVIENTGHTFHRAHPWQENTLPEASEKLANRCIDFLKEVL